MQVIIKGRQLEVTPRLQGVIERKVQRFSRFVDDEVRVEVTVIEEKTRSAQDRFSVQLMIHDTTHPVHSEARAVNVNTALDLVVDKVITQISRQKDRQTRRVRSTKHNAPPLKIMSLSRSGNIAVLEEEDEREEEERLATDEAVSQLPEDSNEEVWSQISEIRRVPSKPMNDKEAIAQMELDGSTFLPFFNEATGTVNVMYRLDNGSYGILVPALS